MRRESAVHAHEARNPRKRPVLGQYEVHADVEARTAPREPDRVVECGTGRHQRHRRHDAAVVRVDDPEIHGLV